VRRDERSEYRYDNRDEQNGETKDKAAVSEHAAHT
jgi:hypothetical protein